MSRTDPSRRVVSLTAILNIVTDERNVGYLRRVFSADPSVKYDPTHTMSVPYGD